MSFIPIPIEKKNTRLTKKCRLVLGGGLSFLSTQYGWVSNNIVEYEIVLANASIITASESHNADLWKALKGGINNYGVVTAYTMKAHPQGQIWGGNIVYTADQTPQILAAVRDFTEYYPDDKAGIVSVPFALEFRKAQYLSHGHYQAQRILRVLTMT